MSPYCWLSGPVQMTTMGQCYAYAHNRLNRLFFHPRSHPDRIPAGPPVRPTTPTADAPRGASGGPRDRSSYIKSKSHGQTTEYEASRAGQVGFIPHFSGQPSSAHCRLKLPASPARRNACWVAWPFGSVGRSEDHRMPLWWFLRFRPSMSIMYPTSCTHRLSRLSC
jgi:hypothetical protein